MSVGTTPSSDSVGKRSAAGAGPAAASKSSYDPTPKGPSTAGVKYDPKPKSQGAPPPHAGNPALGIPPQGYYGPPGYYPPPGYGGPPGYGAPPMYGFTPQLPNHPKAIPAMVLGIISLGIHLLAVISSGLCCVVTGPLGIVLGVIAFILGLKARKEIAASQGALRGDGLALAGMICGGIGVGVGLLILISGILFFILYVGMLGLF